MSHWNHRVIKTKNGGYQIHEVYYDDSGNIDSWTEGPASPYGETLEELQKEMDFFLKALKFPVLEEYKDSKLFKPGLALREIKENETTT